MKNSQETESLPTVGGLRRRLTLTLQPVWGDEAQPIVRALLEETLGLDLTGLILSADKVVSPSDMEALGSMTERLLGGEPLQYVLGHTAFCGLDVAVRRGVLIPRPETEQLVEWVARETDQPSPRIADIGTGSGCIALALKSMIEKSTVVAADVSEEALTVARGNALRLGLDVEFRHADILTASSDDLGSPFDIVVSNPPYVMMKEKVDMMSHVVDHEPSLALFVPDDDPLLFYRRIATLCREGMLRRGGRLFFEINEALGPETAHVLEALGYEGVEVRADYTGRPRMARALLG